MNLPIEQFIPSGAGLIGTIVGLAGMWFKFQNKVDNLERRDEEQGRQIQNIIDWSHNYEEKAAARRDDINKELAKLEGANLVVNEQFKQIVNMLQEIKERITVLEEKGS